MNRKFDEGDRVFLDWDYEKAENMPRFIVVFSYEDKAWIRLDRDGPQPRFDRQLDRIAQFSRLSHIPR